MNTANEPQEQAAESVAIRFLRKLAPNKEKNPTAAVLLTVFLGPIGAFYMGWKFALGILVWYGVWYVLFQIIAGLIFLAIGETFSVLWLAGIAAAGIAAHYTAALTKKPDISNEE